MHGETLKFESG